MCESLVRPIEDLLHFHRVGIYMRAFMVVDHGILEHLVPIVFEDLHRLVVRASDTLANSGDCDGLFDDFVVVGVELPRRNFLEKFATLTTFLVAQFLDCLLAGLHDFAHPLADVFGDDDGGQFIGSSSTSLATFLRVRVSIDGFKGDESQHTPEQAAPQVPQGHHLAVMVYPPLPSSFSYWYRCEDDHAASAFPLRPSLSPPSFCYVWTQKAEAGEEHLGEVLRRYNIHLCSNIVVVSQKNGL